MSSTDEDQPRPGTAADPTLEEIAAARALLTGIETRVFSVTAAPPTAQHAHQIRRAARRLFGHGS